MKGPGTMQRPVVLYSRPGCPYCFLLRRALRRRRLAFTEVNIWEDPSAAAAVRAAADGNETVPTVHVGNQWLVNPRPARVAELARG